MTWDEAAKLDATNRAQRQGLPPIKLHYEHIQALRKVYGAASMQLPITCLAVQALDRALEQIGEHFPNEEVEIVVRKKETKWGS